jgi:hypothetical protein
VPTGFTQLWCSADGFYHNFMQELYDVPAEGLRLQAVRTGIVRVKVVDADDKPVTSNFIISIEPEGGSRVGTWGGSANVQENGTFTFQGVPPGRYRISGHPNPQSGKYQADEKWVDVASAKTVEVQIVHK